MRIAIVPSDKMVYINNESQDNLCLDCIPQNIRALQWYGDHGEIEYNDGSHNEDITSLPDWVQPCVEAWNNKKQEPEPTLPEPKNYMEARAQEYPGMDIYFDGLVKGDQAQMQAYIDACLAVKAKYPKPTEG